MPALSAHHSTLVTKALVIGDSGAGKTGALASLAQAGYNVRILDLDNGLDVLTNLLTDSKSPYGREAAGRVHFETLTDPMRNLNGKLVPKQATVWTRSCKLLDKWETEGCAFGPISTWTSQEVLVIDSLSFLCSAAMNFILSMNNRLAQQPQQSDWYAAQQLVESMLQMLYDEGVGCNVVINCHITYIGEENGPQHGYPASLGKALSPKIGRYFNTVLMAKTTGLGSSQKRELLTQSTGMIELKNTSPLKVKPKYPLETGLAQYFADVRGEQAPKAPGP